MLPGIGSSGSGSRQIGSGPGTIRSHGELNSMAALEGLANSSPKKRCQEPWREGGARQGAQEARGGAGEVAQMLRAGTALPEDWIAIPSTHIVCQF